jgi:malate permease and related proteins
MDIVIEVLSDQNFLGAILSSVAFILLGYFLRYFKILNEHGKSVLNVLVMKVAIPCMAFCAFMSDFSSEDFVNNLLVFAFDIGFYVVAILLGNLFFFRKDKDKRKIYAILMAVGQLTLFSMPILQAVYGIDSGVLIPASMMSIAFRLVVYIYGYIVITGEKMTKDNVGKTLKRIFLNPVMILMFLGLVIWLTQNYVFQVDVTVDGEIVKYGFTRIDKTLPALYKIFQLGNNLATPLAMLLMGVTLGEANFLSALKNRLAWLIAVMKSLVLPLMILGVLILLGLCGASKFSELQMACLVIGNAAPTSAVLVVFCVNSDKEAYLGSDAVMLSTILSLISMPVLFVLLKLALTLPFFA